MTTSDTPLLTGIYPCAQCPAFQIMERNVAALLNRSTSTTDAPALYLDPAGDLAQAVAGGEFVEGELKGQQPAGSQLGQSFVGRKWLYLYRPGYANAPVWCRIAKL